MLGESLVDSSVMPTAKNVDRDVPTSPNSMPTEPTGVTAKTNSAPERRSVMERQVFNSPIVLRHGSTSQRLQQKLEGLCKNLSVSGCGLLLYYPPLVGDIYRIELVEHPEHPLNGRFIRCVRCHLLDEDTFEAGFSLLAPLKTTRLRNESNTHTIDPLV